MLSHINLVEAILSSRQLDLSRRPGRLPDIRRTGLSFEKVLTKSLEGCPSIFPLNNEISAADAKFQEGLKVILESEGSKYVWEYGGKESSRYGILQSTARECGYKGNN